MWVAAYGPLALKLTGEVGDGFILQLADPDIAAWMIKAVRDAAEQAGPGPRRDQVLRRRPDVRRRRTRRRAAHMREQCRWFGGMVGNHVADIVARYGADSSVPKALTDYIEGRQGYDYNEHGRAGNTPRRVRARRDRRAVLPARQPAASTSRSSRPCASSASTQFAGYLQHDNKEETLRVYGEHVIPALATPVVATA